MKRQLWLLAGVTMVITGLAGAPAGAFTMTQKCVIGNQLCFVTRASAGGMTAEKRLDRVNERLAYILGYESLRPGNVRMVSRDGAQEIRVGQSLLVTVTRRDARANGMRDPRSLGREWLRNLRDALPEARPAVNIAAVTRPSQVARGE